MVEIERLPSNQRLAHQRRSVRILERFNDLDNSEKYEKIEKSWHDETRPIIRFSSFDLQSVYFRRARTSQFFHYFFEIFLDHKLYDIDYIV